LVHGLEPDLLEVAEDALPDLDDLVTATDLAVAVVAEDGVLVQERRKTVGVLGVERLDEVTDEGVVVDGSHAPGDDG
jgi:hypothetical protein